MDANIDLETEITPQMIEAGVIRLGELLQAGTGSAYTVLEVFLAMRVAAELEPKEGQLSPPDERANTKDC